MGKNPAFPFYANDYLVDTMRWSRGMKALHVDLMCESWSNKEIKDDGGYPAGLNDEDRNIWDKIKHKWVLQNGVWSNLKLEEARAKRKFFLEKQHLNGKKGGRPKKEEPKHNPSLLISKPKQNPIEDEIENEEEILIEIEDILQKGFKEALFKRLEGEGNYPNIDIRLQFKQFQDKVRGAPDKYQDHGLSGIRQAFYKQLRDAKPNGTIRPTKASTQSTQPFSGDYTGNGGPVLRCDVDL